MTPIEARLAVEARLASKGTVIEGEVPEEFLEEGPPPLAVPDPILSSQDTGLPEPLLRRIWQAREALEGSLNRG